MGPYTFFDTGSHNSELSIVEVLRRATSSTDAAFIVWKDGACLPTANEKNECITIVFSAFAGVPYHIYLPCKRTIKATSQYVVDRDKIRIFNTNSKQIVKNISINCQRALVACVYDGIYDHVGICSPAVKMQSIGRATWDFECLDVCIGLVPDNHTGTIRFINARLLVKGGTGEVHWVLSKGTCHDVDRPTMNLVHEMRECVLRGSETISHLYSDDGLEGYACPEFLMQRILRMP